MDDYHLEDIYQGGYSTLDPNTGFTGYRIPAGQLGIATDPRTANIVQEVATKLKSGAKQIEISTIQPGTFESIPTQQLREVKRLSALTGVDISVHAPLIEPSGISQQGGYNELAREEAERQMLSAIEKSHEMDLNGNIPVTFHSSVTWQGPEYKRLKEGEEKARIPIINQDTGQMAMVQAGQRFSPRMTEDELIKGMRESAEKQIEVRNETEWSDSITNLVQIKERADRMINETQVFADSIQEKIKTGSNLESLGPEERRQASRHHNAGLELGEIQKHLSGLFEKAYKISIAENNEASQKQLKEISKEFRESLSEAKSPWDLAAQSRAMDSLMQNLDAMEAPKVYKPVEDFAVERSATTFANAAFNSYKKFGDKAPIISIENPPVGGGLSRAEDLKKLVEMAREKFVETAVNGGMKRVEAEAAASKTIGVTWDVGHINMLRKYGYSEKDVIAEAEKVAPLVKHVHLSDNFGFEHTELPMGMGNVPIKAIMEKLGEKGFEARKIIEAGNWWEHFKTSPFQQTLEAFGSPIYGIKMQPYWTQAVGTQGYFSGYGQMLPQINYETFGSGFSTLPAELGGQRQQTGRSRMSGSPME
jgi:sugar phosphate isomerase/epimerase